MLAHEQRINRSSDFKRVFATGQKYFGRYVIIFRVPNGTAGNDRFGFITSKKLGGAVIRNRARRQIREIIRQEKIDNSQGYDVVIVARASIVGQSSASIRKDLLINLRKAGLC